MMGNRLGSQGSSRDKEAAPFSLQPAARLPLTDECKHYTGKHQVPWDNQKYFAQRYSIFSLYDEGIQLTDDAWFGVTPEPVAREVARDIAGAKDCKKTLIDAFAGAGGNTIAFALSQRWEHIVAIEQDASTLACAQHNAQVYGVDSSLITWVLGDSFEYINTLVHDPDKLHPDLHVDVDKCVLFASPPWGGPGYTCDKIFDLGTMQPYNLEQLHTAYRAMDHGLFLPRTSDIRQIARLAPRGRKIRVVQYCLQGASKAMVAYIPAEFPATGDGVRPSAGDEIPRQA